MDLRILNLAIVLLIGLSACGSEPEPVNMDRRYLAGAYLEAAKADILGEVRGEVLDSYEWVLGEKKVFTVLSKERDADTEFRGIYLRQYDLSGQFANLMWTYQDSVSCTSDSAGGAGADVDATRSSSAGLVSDASPALRPVAISGEVPQQFVLHYQLGCTATGLGNHLVVVDGVTGTPDVRLFGRGRVIEEASGLRELSEDTIRQLMAVWG